MRTLLYPCPGKCEECGADADVIADGVTLCPVHLGWKCAACGGDVLTSGACEDCGREAA